MSLQVDIRKSWKDFSLNVCFDLDKGPLGILGASGCGKSMTLKCIAGILRPDEGKIILNGRSLFDSEKKIDLKPQMELMKNCLLIKHEEIIAVVYAAAFDLLTNVGK